MRGAAQLHGYCNREVDRLVEEQSQQTDPGARKQLVWEIEQKAPNITNAGEIAELDSLLEGDGFELSVPIGDNIFETAPFEL